VLLRKFQQAHPGRLLVFEAMWREFMTVATQICGLSAAFESEHDVTLLIEADMGEDPAGTEAFSLLLSEFYEQDLIKDAVVAQSRADRNRFWAYRETPYEYGRFLPEEIRFDVSVPLNRMSEAVEHLRQEMPRQWPDAIYVVFGHVADSNIHINVAIRDMDDSTRKGVQKLVYDLVSELEGSISAEHGIGRIKRPYLPLSRTEPERAVMAKMKQMLDPEGILNPGRVL
jgi:FAD/FMN-containing dehydrogenase